MRRENPEFSRQTKAGWLKLLGAVGPAQPVMNEKGFSDGDCQIEFGEQPTATIRSLDSSDSEFLNRRTTAEYLSRGVRPKISLLRKGRQDRVSRARNENQRYLALYLALSDCGQTLL